MSDLIYMLLLLVLGISAAVLFIVLKLKADGPRLYDVLAFSDGQRIAGGDSRPLSAT